MIGTLHRAAAAALLGLSLAAPAAARDLVMGVAAEPTSADPHYHTLTPNNALARHLHGYLVDVDADQKPAPGLALSWRALDETTWEFKLRPGVTFSNGAPFTARDVIHTFCRVPKVENSPSSFVIYTREIETLRAPDPLTLVVTTRGPTPLLPQQIGAVAILSADAAGAPATIAYDKNGCADFGANPKSADFARPERFVGAGPFKLAAFERGGPIVLARNERYWGPAPAFEKVTIRPIVNNGARVAALLAGDIDLAEAPPIQDLERIRAAGFGVSTRLSNRIIYLALDQNPDPAWKSPGIGGVDRNPFLDPRVREAVSRAINRRAIVERIMGGSAVAAAELLPWPLFGTTKDLPIDAYDPEAARRLLIEAGFGAGFDLVIGTPNDRYMNDDKIAQALAQMLTRIGIRARVDAMTSGVFFDRRGKRQFSAYLAGWGASSGEMSNPLVSLALTHDPKRGLGPNNHGLYSNPRLDEMVLRAQRTVDDAAREALLREASRLAMSDRGVIPLHFEVTPWAFRKGLAYPGRTDQYTLAHQVTPAN